MSARAVIAPQRSTRRPPRQALVGALGALLMVSVAGSPPAAQAQTTQVRYALLVGSNLGNQSDRALKYAEEDVIRIADLLRRSGGFDEVLLLRSARAPAVQDAFKKLQMRLAGDRSAGRSSLVFFYYSGHGDHEALELAETRLPLRYLRESLEALEADVKIAFVDACHSGAMTGVKGGRRAPGYEVRMADPGSVRGLAIVTSSTGSELSQESDELRASFFSHSVMSGLQGAADTSGDGQVTLSELYQFAFRRTLSTTAASLVGGQHPTYDYRMAGTGEVILTRAQSQDARIVFPRSTTGSFMVMSRDRVVAEVSSTTEQDQYLAVPAGEYRVLRRTIGGISEASLRLGPGATIRVDMRGMVAVRSTGGIAKKGGTPSDGAYSDALLTSDVDLERDALGGRPHLLIGSYGVQSSPVAGAAAFPTVALTYRRTWSRFEAGLRGAWASFDADDRGYRSSLTRLFAGADVSMLLGAWNDLRLTAGMTAGIPWTRQTDDVGETSTTFGLRYGGRGALTWSAYGPLFLSAELEAGAESFALQGATVHRPFVGAGLGVGVALR